MIEKLACFQTTYEELKPDNYKRKPSRPRFQTTYEELKLNNGIERIRNRAASRLPMRN